MVVQIVHILILCTIFRWKDSEDSRIASEIETLQSDDWRLNLISRYMDIVRTNLRQGSVKKTIPWRTLNGHSELLPEKFMTLNTSGSNETESSGRKSSNRNLGIFQEIRQRLHRLGRKNRRNSSTQLPKFSSEELLQTNSVLCALLHTYQHQNMDSMIRVYIKEAKERFEQSKMVSQLLSDFRLSQFLEFSSKGYVKDELFVKRFFKQSYLFEQSLPKSNKLFSVL
jgi:hypothetical protein